MIIFLFCKFPGSLDLTPVPQGEVSKFIKANDIISPVALYQKFNSSDCHGLVWTQFLAALNIYLSGNSEISNDAMSEFVWVTLSMQELCKSNDIVLIKFDDITDWIC